ncbi:isochorismatase family cysteine hydrolase [Amycolatopsis sp.]|uniref:isochorismatase family cysteine hydrolase n=1 Tax=Amycolatopsis sp. TaxID=37632 RepID=UPI002C769188|nr:isochorismatase family cysteine hydrolase [Amycolatopsis sp.]HVV10649.1 isochorismatase family cysteine hydrolase [Amycolatopsis sp.]
MSPWELDRRRSALLVIDMQNDFVRRGFPMEVPMARARIGAMREVAARCRAVGVPVLCTRHVLFDSFDVSPLETARNPALRTAGLRAGSHGAEIVEELAPEPGEVVIDKHRYDAFHNTPLHSVLTTIRGPHVVDTVIITGTLTDVCCESTARSAFMRDYKVAFAADATGALSEAAQEATRRCAASKRSSAAFPATPS